MLSTAIKEATKTAHQELEKKVVKQLKGIRSNADYAELLRNFYAYFSHVERVISPYITRDILPDYSDRRNAVYLKNDIEELGGNIQDLPATNVPGIANALQALGALYVMEGSIMGGGIIVQMLGKGGIHQGVSFFSGYGPATGAKWGTFIETLNNQAISEEDQALVINAANETFTRFSALFEQVEAE